jgi:hypothetical protein
LTVFLAIIISFLASLFEIEVAFVSTFLHIIASFLADVAPTASDA